MERERKISRREFLRKLGKVTAGIVGGITIYEILKKLQKERIENAPEGIYYALTNEKIDLPSLTDENLNTVLDQLKNALQKKLNIEVELKKFENLDDGLKNLNQDKNKTIILVLWPTKDYPEYTPSLGIVEEVSENKIIVWDPNYKDQIIYKNSLKIWKAKNRPIIYLTLSEKFSISPEIKEEITRKIIESRERP